MKGDRGKSMETFDLWMKIPHTALQCSLETHSLKTWRRIDPQTHDIVFRLKAFSHPAKTISKEKLHHCADVLQWQTQGGVRDARPLLGPIFLLFSYSLTKYCQIKDCFPSEKSWIYHCIERQWRIQAMYIEF